MGDHRADGHRISFDTKRIIVGHQPCRHFECRCFNEALRGLFMRQQGFHFAAQFFITPTGVLQKRSALLSGNLQLAANAQDPWRLAPLRSRNNHTLASFQSRITVSLDTFSTSAVSLTSRPPKNRNSTTQAFLSSTRARRFNASSSATRLLSGCEETTSASSNGI